MASPIPLSRFTPSVVGGAGFLRQAIQTSFVRTSIIRQSSSELPGLRKFCAFCIVCMSILLVILLIITPLQPMADQNRICTCETIDSQAAS